MIPLGIVASSHQETPASSPLSSTFLQHAGNSTSLTTHTFTAQNLGPASADREIIVVVGGIGNAGGSRTVNSVTVGGVTASVVHSRPSNSVPMAMYRAAVPTGTTGDVVVTFSGTASCSIALWAVTGGISAENATGTTNTGSSSTAATVTGYTDGVIIAGIVRFASSGTFTWTNATERYDAVVISGALVGSGASSTAVGSTTVTSTHASTFTKQLIVAAFAP
jgi:hypothetical protein